MIHFKSQCYITMNVTMYNNIKQRIYWIDICKGIAIIFIYLGHWKTSSSRLELFAYSFHLQLFLILSGFFALKYQDKAIFEFLKNQVKRLLIPLTFLGILNVIYFDIDTQKTFYEVIQNFATLYLDYSNSVSPQLWFIPCLFVVLITCYFLLKHFRKPFILLVFAYILLMIQLRWKDTILGGIILKPFINIL